MLPVYINVCIQPVFEWKFGACFWGWAFGYDESAWSFTYLLSRNRSHCCLKTFKSQQSRSFLIECHMSQQL